MTPPTLDRHVLILLAASSCVFTAGVASQFEVGATSAQSLCVGGSEETERSEVLPLPIVIPAVAEPPAVAFEIECDVDGAAGPTTDTVELSPGAFAFVVHLDGPHVVLATEVPSSWAEGPTQLETPGRVSAALRVEALPAEVRALEGQTFALYDAEGKRGSARLGPPRIVSQAEGEIADGVDTFLAWDRFEDPEGRIEVEEDRALIDAVWQHGRRLVVAPVQSDIVADWARLDALPPPVVLRVDDIPADQVEEELPWAWQDPAVLDWLGGFEVYRTAAGEGDRMDLSDLLVGARWSDEHGVGMVTFSLSDPDGFGCEGYGQSVWGAADRRAGLDRPGLPGFGPVAVMDIDGDGILDVVTFGSEETERVLHRGTPAGFVATLTLPSPVFVGCPC